jgi:hypothetical protein
MTARPEPRFPVYIPSKGRADWAHTTHTLDRIRVPWLMVVEEPQWRDYRRRYPAERLLVLPHEYQDAYDTCDDLGDEFPKGAGPARNFAWEHAKAEGHEWHWLMDDNIREFCYFNNNAITAAGDSMILAAMEDFCLRYENVGMAGPQYETFVAARERRTRPFTLNTRIFSCNLIRNDIEPRWHGRFNEDLMLSIAVLRAGWCTVLFDTMLQEKSTTQRTPGGYTTEYKRLSTLPKSQLAVRKHGDIVRLVWRYGRWHHAADFSEFKTMHLIRKPGWEPPAVNPYRTVTRLNPTYRKRFNP